MRHQDDRGPPVLPARDSLLLGEGPDDSTAQGRHPRLMEAPATGPVQARDQRGARPQQHPRRDLYPSRLPRARPVADLGRAAERPVGRRAPAAPAGAAHGAFRRRCSVPSGRPGQLGVYPEHPEAGGGAPHARTGDSRVGLCGVGLCGRAGAASLRPGGGTRGGLGYRPARSEHCLVQEQSLAPVQVHNLHRVSAPAVRGQHVHARLRGPVFTHSRT